MPFNSKVITMLHKMDVFSHTLPEGMKTGYDFFRSFMTQNGERSVTADLVAQMFLERRGEPAAWAGVVRCDSRAHG